MWYAHIDVETVFKELQGQVDPVARKRAEANVAKARTRDSTQALDKLTHVVDGERRIISDPPLIEPVEEVAEGHGPRPDHGLPASRDAQLPAARSRATVATSWRTSA